MVLLCRNGEVFPVNPFLSANHIGGSGVYIQHKGCCHPDTEMEMDMNTNKSVSQISSSSVQLLDKKGGRFYPIWTTLPWAPFIYCQYRGTLLTSFPHGKQLSNWPQWLSSLFDKTLKLAALFSVYNFAITLSHEEPSSLHSTLVSQFKFKVHSPSVLPALREE